VKAFEPAAPSARRPPKRKRLEFLVRAGNTPQKLVQRARIILLAAAGRANAAIAREAGVSCPTVGGSAAGVSTASTR